MKRRSIISIAGRVTLGVALPVMGQTPPKVWHIGFLSGGHVDRVETDYIYGPFTQGMRELGYVQGRNLVIEWRSGEGKSEPLPQLAAELVRLKLDVLVTAATPATLAAQKATTTIPIVMISVGDPVGAGLVKSLARPGGNTTGLGNLATDLGPKLLEMLRAIVPKIGRVALLTNPSNPGSVLYVKSVQAAAEMVGVKIQPVGAGSPEEIDNGFAAMAYQNAGALIVAREQLFQQQKDQILRLTAKHRLPSIGSYSEYVESGGLVSYGNHIQENYRRAATYVDKILKGANPADLPVEQPTRFELVINMKTAKVLGIKVPQSLLLQATRVIE